MISNDLLAELYFVKKMLCNKKKKEKFLQVFLLRKGRVANTGKSFSGAGLRSTDCENAARIAKGYGKQKHIKKSPRLCKVLIHINHRFSQRKLICIIPEPT